MSLINKMLQDLDARRSEVTGADAYGFQIRAVPARRRLHVAWWIAAALGIGLAGVIAWGVLRHAPAATAARADTHSQLSLQSNKALSVTPPSPLQGPIKQETSKAVTEMPTASAVTQTIDVPAAESQSDGQANAIAGTPAAAAPMAVAEKPVAAVKPPVKVTADKPVRSAKPSVIAAPVAKEAPAAPLPPAKAVPAEKPLAAAPAMKLPDAVPPVTLNKQIKELTPQQRADNEYRKATLSMQQGKAAEALSGLEQALQLDPRHAAARHTLVGLLLENKRQEEALRNAREGLSLDPAQPALAMIAARLQLEKGELRPAVETLEKTLPYASERADYQSFLAALLQREGRNKEAAERYLLALQKAPQNGVWWMGLGISLQAENRLPEAQESFNRAKASNSLSPELLAFVESKLKQLQR